MHEYKLGSIVEMKKAHPCGNNEWVITRIGADIKIKCINTPGHSEGSTCYIIDNFLFCGDTLFAGSIGRTDFYSGDYKQIEKSLKKLSKFENNVKIHPGHGPSSTLGIEKMSNPYM